MGRLSRLSSASFLLAASLALGSSAAQAPGEIEGWSCTCRAPSDREVCVKDRANLGYMCATGCAGEPKRKMCVPQDAFVQMGSGDAGPYYVTEHGRTYATVMKSMPPDKSPGRIVYSMFVPLPADVQVNYAEVTYYTRAADPAECAKDVRYTQCSGTMRPNTHNDVHCGAGGGFIGIGHATRIADGAPHLEVRLWNTHRQDRLCAKVTVRIR